MFVCPERVRPQALAHRQVLSPFMARLWFTARALEACGQGSVGRGLFPLHSDTIAAQLRGEMPVALWLNDYTKGSEPVEIVCE